MPKAVNIKRSKVKNLALIIAPLISLLVILFGNLDPDNTKITYTFAIALLMAIWWVTEAIPLAATALLPVALFPLFGVVDGETISAMYFNHLIFLFIGGFLIALAMERWNLHKRIALKILIFFGISPGRILMGFMLATSFLSMWMSNTATTMMMIPIAMSIILKLEENLGKQKVARYSIGLLLGIAYSASIGGIATLVGTPPNLSFVRIIGIIFPEIPEISFAEWLVFALPVSILLFVMAWLLLYFMYKPKQGWGSLGRDEFRDEYKLLGKAKYEEKIVFTLFLTLAFLWIFRKGLTIQSFVLTLVIVTFMSLLTELTSNTATTEMILPILAGLAVSIKVNPLLLMVPATLAASLAFMLPVATPPNAIVFGTNHLKIKDMVRTGFILNLAGIVVATLLMYYWGSLVFNIDMGVFPDWAANSVTQGK